MAFNNLSIGYFPSDIDWIAFIDESGNNDIKKLVKKRNSGMSFENLSHTRNHINFCISACIFYKKDFENCKRLIVDIKNKYWDSGQFLYKNEIRRVCLHSRDIRRKNGPFNLDESNYTSFQDDLKKLLTQSNFKIVSSYTNKAKHVRKYRSPYPVYSLNMEFIIERIVRNFEGNGVIILESRGQNNDKNLKVIIEKLLKFGNTYISPNDCKKIKGIYFNNKWTEDYQMTYFGIEISDLVVYSISKFCSDGLRDNIFDAIENKLLKYPNYYGYGIKKFPNT